MPCLRPPDDELTVYQVDSQGIIDDLVAQGWIEINCPGGPLAIITNLFDGENPEL